MSGGDDGANDSASVPLTRETFAGAGLEVEELELSRLAEPARLLQAMLFRLRSSHLPSEPAVVFQPAPEPPPDRP